MLLTIAVILFVLWLIGAIALPTTGLVHALLVIAIIVVLIRLIQGNPPLA